MSIYVRAQTTLGRFRLDVDMQVPEDGVTAISGPSGAGKTTLLRTIAGLQKPDSGQLRMGDAIWQDKHRFVPAHRRRVGYVFQESGLFPHLSVRGNLRYGMRRVPGPQRRIAYDDVVDWLWLTPLLARDPTTLSGGERQRVAIARALLTSPDLLLLDEPLASLDAASRNDILPCLDKLRARLGLPVIYVSHATDEVARLADTVVLMQDGQTLASGPIGELLTRFDLPLALAPDAEAVIDATISGHDAHYDLTWLDFSGGRFTVAGCRPRTGQSVRLRILARDVSLTRTHQADTSILNVFPARVEAVAPGQQAVTVVRLRLGDAALLAQLTRKSVDTLGIEAGQQLFAQVKTAAVLD